MTVGTLTGQTGQPAIDVINAAIALVNAVDGRTTGMPAQIAALQTAIDQLLATTAATQADGRNETQARAAADEDMAAKLATVSAAIPDLETTTSTLSNAVQALQQSVAGETSARAAAVAQLATILGAGILGHGNKPGDNPFLFTTSPAGLADAVAPLPMTGVIMSVLGRVFRATGNQTVATRSTIWNEPGRVRALRFAYQRFAAPSDPSNDAVQCGIAFLDQNGVSLSEVSVRTDLHPVALAGMQVVACRLPSQVGDAIVVTPPAGWVEARPFMRAFGADGTTDFIMLAVTDVTDAGSYSPDLTATNSRVTALETSVAGLNPVATGTPNGLATLNSSGTVVQLPMLKSAFLEAAAQFVPGAGFVVDNAVSGQGDHTLSMEHFHNPYVAAGSAWVAFVQATLGLTTAQVTTILSTIGSPAQRGGTAPPTIIYDLDVTTASVMRSCRARFATIANADMSAFYATFVGDQGSDSFYVVWGERYAPVGGALYQLLLAYLTSSPGPGLSQSAATAQLTTIWANAINYRPSA